MSLFRIEWGSIVAMENDIIDVGRMGDVLTTIGSGSESLSPGGCYLLGTILTQMGRRLEAQFDALGNGPGEGRCE